MVCTPGFEGIAVLYDEALFICTGENNKSVVIRYWREKTPGGNVKTSVLCMTVCYGLNM